MGKGEGNAIAFVRARPAEGAAASEPPVELLTAAGAVRQALDVPDGPRLRCVLFDAGSGPGDVERTEAELRALRPRAVVLGRGSSNFAAPLGSSDVEAVVELGSRLRGLAPRIALVDDDRSRAETLLAQDAADLSIRGDADEVLPSVLRVLLAPEATPEAAARSVDGRGVTWRRPDGAIGHGPGASRPRRPATPAWDLLDLSPYSAAAESGLVARIRRRLGAGAPASAVAAVRTTRACIPDCPTCRGSFGASGPERPVREVIAEIRQLVTTRRVRELRILDHAFDGRPARAVEIARGIAQLKASPALRGLRVEFPAGFRGDGLDDALIDALLDLDIRRFDLRIGTAAERLQRLFKRNVHLGRANDALVRIERRGGVGRVSLALGLPTETTGEAAHTIQWAARSAARELTLENGREAAWAAALNLRGPDDVDDFSALRRRARRAFFTDPRRGALRIVRAGALRSGWAARAWSNVPPARAAIAARRALGPAAS